MAMDFVQQKFLRQGLPLGSEPKSKISRRCAGQFLEPSVEHGLPLERRNITNISKWIPREVSSMLHMMLRMMSTCVGDEMKRLRDDGGTS